MKDDTELDDGILGTALARAVDAQPVRETPFAASRVATLADDRRRRSFLWPGLAAAAVMVLALAVGSALAARLAAENTPAATQPVSVPTAVPTPQLASAQPVAAPAVPVRVYFARDGLPPVAASVLGHASTPNTDTPRDHVGNRIEALLEAQARDIPPGARTAIVISPAPGATQTSTRTSVAIDGDTATVDLTFEPPLLVRSDADVRAILQQIVYTATEEPGIRRVRLTTDNGKPMAVGPYRFPTTALAREDVAGYASSGLTGTFAFEGASVPSQLTTSYSVDAVAPALARFTIAVSGLPSHTAPSFTVTAYDSTHMPGANAELEITIPNGSDATTAAAQVDRPPLRSIAIGSPGTFPAKVYRLGLDHLWPWRAVILYDPTRIVIDIGGAPSAISTDLLNVVYAPTGNAEVGHTFTLSGAARAYEGTVNFRVRDARTSIPGAADGAVLLYGYAKASIGSTSVYGAYDATVTLPDSVPATALLEVFEVSPKDGTELSKVTIPLRVR